MVIAIRHIAKFPSADSARRGQMDTIVFYQIDGKAMDSITLLKDSNDPKEMEAAIRAELTKRQSALKHTFTV